MHQNQNKLKSYPAKVVASVTSWEDWRGLDGLANDDSCDWLELRLDLMPKDIELDALMKINPTIPVLVTARRVEEGGQRDMSDEERLSLLAHFLPQAIALDVEIACLPQAEALIALAHEQGKLVIASAHDFFGTPPVQDLIHLEHEARRYGADVVKFAFRLNRPEDILIGCELLERRTGALAVMGMGSLGPCSRLMYAQLGSCLVYGYYGKVESAPGQWAAGEFKHALRLLKAIR
ncbi:MAG: type I 3-dehydroquinate dehydratase [Akkermansia sp.]